MVKDGIILTSMLLFADFSGIGTDTVVPLAQARKAANTLAHILD